MDVNTNFDIHQEKYNWSEMENFTTYENSNSTFIGERINDEARVFFAVMGSVMVLGGVIGNWLLIAVISKHFLRKRCVHNLFIANLALADILTLGYWFTFFVLDLILGFHPVVDHAHCVANGVVVAVLCLVTVTSLLSISLNRYLHVCHSHLYTRVFTFPRTVLCCFLTWVTGIVLALPPVFLGGSAGTYHYNHRAHFCSFDRKGLTYPKVMVVLFATLPMVVIAYCNFAIFRFWRNARMKLTCRYPTLTRERSKGRKLFAKWKAGFKGKNSLPRIAVATAGGSCGPVLEEQPESLAVESREDFATVPQAEESSVEVLKDNEVHAVNEAKENPAVFANDGSDRTVHSGPKELADQSSLGCSNQHNNDVGGAVNVSSPHAEERPAIVSKQVGGEHNMSPVDENSDAVDKDIIGALDECDADGGGHFSRIPEAKDQSPDTRDIPKVSHTHRDSTPTPCDQDDPKPLQPCQEDDEIKPHSSNHIHTVLEATVTVSESKKTLNHNHAFDDSPISETDRESASCSNRDKIPKSTMERSTDRSKDNPEATAPRNNEKGDSAKGLSLLNRVFKRKPTSAPKQLNAESTEATAQTSNVEEDSTKRRSLLNRVFKRKPVNTSQHTLKKGRQDSASQSTSQTLAPVTSVSSSSTYKQRTIVFRATSRRMKRHANPAVHTLQKRMKKSKAREIAFVRSLFVVFILNFLFFVPYGIIIVTDSYVTMPSEVVILGNVLLFLNNAVNWIVYGAMNPTFRKGYVKYARRVLATCCCCLEKARELQLNASLSSLVTASSQKLNTDAEVEASFTSQYTSGVAE